MKNTMLFAIGLVLCFEASASAQTTDDTFRLTADLSLFQYRRDRVSLDFRGDSDTQHLGFSLLSNGLGVVLGKNLSESFFLGARVSLAVQSISGPLSDYSTIDWALGPQAEYRFRSEGTFRPYAQLGATFSSSSESALGDRHITRYLGFQVGIGANIFATNTFSIDPRLEVGYETQIATTRTDSSSRSRLRFSLQLALSVWLGAEDAQAADSSRTQSPSNRVTVVPTPPRFEYARDGERIRGVRMHLQTRTTSLIFTYGPEDSVDSVKLELQSTNGRPLRNCRVFMMNNVEGRLRAEIQTGNEAALSVDELRSTTQDRGTTNVRFCGRVWRVDRTATAAFTRFLQNVDDARAQWAERVPSGTPSVVVEEPAEQVVTEPPMEPVVTRRNRARRLKASPDPLSRRQRTQP